MITRRIALYAGDAPRRWLLQVWTIRQSREGRGGRAHGPTLLGDGGRLSIEIHEFSAGLCREVDALQSRPRMYAFTDRG